MAVGARGRFDAYGPRLAHTWIAGEPDRRHRSMEATLGFFDVVGYTSLTERLARAGPAGAEAVTETTDRIFAALIDPILDAGGDVLQFSGDALLVLFADEGHAIRACTAARQMQRVMAEVGRVETLAGRARLRMSAGMHSGIVDLVLIGETQRMVLAVGPTTTGCLLAEKAAGPGDVLVTPATAAAIPTAWCRAERDGLHLLGRVPRPAAAPHAETGAGSPTAAVAEASVPVPLRAPLAAGFTGEHRQVALAFLGLRDLDAFIARDGIAAVADRLQSLARTVEAAQAEYGVTWIAADALPGGADLVLVAGAPVVAEDDEDRIVRAARTVLDAHADLDLVAGVNRGRNFVGPIGHPQRRTVCITGDATNLAARIMARAEIGQLLVHEPLLGGVRGRLVAGPVEPFAVKGKRAPVRAADVRGIGPRAAPATTSDVPLVGREAELAALRSALAARGPGSGRVVEVVAPAGMGKTRLVDALRTETPDTRWLWGGGEAYARSRPHLPWRSVLRSLVGIPADADPSAAAAALRAWGAGVAPELARWLPLLAPIVDADLPEPAGFAALEPDSRRDRLHHTVLAVLRAGLGPQDAIVLDDLHWFDEASRELLEAVAAAAGPAGWFLLVTSRPGAPLVAPDDPAAAWSSTTELEPLGPEAARALVLAVAGPVAISDADIARVGGRADGNPLFLRELVAEVTGPDAAGELPDTVERLIAARLDRLDPTTRLRVREAAVLGRTVDLDLLARMLGEPGSLDPSGWSAGDEFAEVIDPHTLRFRHDLIRDAAYAGLSVRRRRDLHARAADALAAVADDDLAAVVALHATEGRLWPLAWEWAGRAALDAQRKAAFADALAARERAIVAARHLSDLPAVEVAAAHEALAEAAYPLARYELADRCLATAARLLADDPVSVARCCRRRGDIAVLEGRISQGKAWYTRSLRALRDHAGDGVEFERVRARLGRSAALHVANDNRAAVAAAQVALAEAEAADDRDATIEALMLLVTAAAMLGEPDGGPHGAHALAVMREAGDDLRLANTLLNLGVAEHNANRLAAALDRYEEAAAAFDRIGDVVGLALVTHNRGEVLADLGRTDEARAACTDALREFRACGAPLGAALAESALGRLAVFGGDPEGGLALLESAVATFEAAGHEWYTADTRCRIAECHIIFGDLDVATAALAEAEGLAAHVDPPGILPTWLARLHGLLARRRGDPARASVQLERAQALAEAADQPVEAIRALACRVACGLGPDTLGGELAARRAALGLTIVVAIPGPEGF